jgi:cation/acetate symporter
VVVLIAASFTYVVAQIVGVGIITSRFLGISFEVACFVGLIASWSARCLAG